jgi:hypothetical protein
MDFQALQRKLFALDPSDPREDLRKLQEAAGAPKDIEPSIDYLNEQANVPTGSLPLNINSISDFARLAGITVNESQKTGSAGQLKAKDTVKQNPAGSKNNSTRDKLVGEGPLDAIRAGAKSYQSGSMAPGALEKGVKDFFTGSNASPKSTSTPSSTLHPKLITKLETYKTALEKIFTSERELKREFIALMKKADPSLASGRTEEVEEANKMKMPKARDPNWRTMVAKRSSNAMGIHKDKKHDVKIGKEKHKKDYATESIKDKLWAALKEHDV